MANIKTDFGVNGGRSTDLTAPIQNAIDSVIANGERELVFPDQEYRCDSPLTITDHHVTLRGVNRRWSTLLSVADDDHPVLQVGNTTSNTHTPTLVRMGFKHDHPTYNHGGAAIHFTRVTDGMLFDLDVSGFGVGVQLTRGARCQAHTVYTYAKGRTARATAGFLLEGLGAQHGTGNVISHCMVQNNSTISGAAYRAGILVRSADAAYIDHNHAIACQYGMLIEPDGTPGANYIEHIDSDHNYWDACIINGVRIAGSANTYQNLSFDHDYVRASGRKGMMFHADMKVKNVNVSGTRFRFCDDVGLWVRKNVESFSVGGNCVFENNNRGGYRTPDDDIIIRPPDAIVGKLIRTHRKLVIQ